MINIPKDDKGRLSLAHALARVPAHERKQVLDFADLPDVEPAVKNRELRRAQDYVTTLREADSLTDGLTGIANTRAFKMELERVHSMVTRDVKIRSGAVKDGRMQTAPIRYYLAFFDMNGMKGLNDTCGHKAGDEALCIFSNALSSVLKRKDEMCARIGGDEFVVLLRDDGKPKFVARAHEYFKEKLKPLPFTCGDVTYNLTTGFGMTEIKPHRSADESLAIADAMANRSKRRLGVERGKLPPILSVATDKEPVMEIHIMSVAFDVSEDAPASGPFSTPEPAV